MNRAQRQLLFLTNQFHHDYYIESLLLVINNISFNILTVRKDFKHIENDLFKKEEEQKEAT